MGTLCFDGVRGSRLGSHQETTLSLAPTLSPLDSAHWHLPPPAGEQRREGGHGPAGYGGPGPACGSHFGCGSSPHTGLGAARVMLPCRGQHRPSHLLLP
jgi:hypothetical protein